MISLGIEDIFARKADQTDIIDVIQLLDCLYITVKDTIFNTARFFSHVTGSFSILPISSRMAEQLRTSFLEQINNILDRTSIYNSFLKTCVFYIGFFLQMIMPANATDEEKVYMHERLGDLHLLTRSRREGAVFNSLLESMKMSLEKEIPLRKIPR